MRVNTCRSIESVVCRLVVLRRRWLIKLDLLKYNLGWEMIYNISIAVE